jgi:hypothetical protein
MSSVFDIRTRIQNDHAVGGWELTLAAETDCIPRIGIVGIGICPPDGLYPFPLRLREWVLSGGLGSALVVVLVVSAATTFLPMALGAVV